MRSTVFAITVSSSLVLGCSSSVPEPTGVVPVRPEGASSSEKSSPKLKASETKIDQREFAALEHRSYTIKTDVPVWVGFRTKLSPEQKAKIQPSTNSFGQTASVAAQVLEVSDAKHAVYVGTNSGGAAQMQPDDGQIQIQVSNFCDCPLEIIVYQKACTAEELKQL